jgi:hypothetical protein
MCDYSLMGLPNRLAVKEEELVVHRFPTGSLGLAAPSDLAPADSSMGRPKSFWAAVKLFLNPPAPPSVRAVCIPPGATLVAADIPASMQRALGVGQIELVTFTLITQLQNRSVQCEAAGSYRDAVRFRNGREVRLQDLHEGQRMWVMDLAGAETYTPLREAISGV